MHEDCGLVTDKTTNKEKLMSQLQFEEGGKLSLRFPPESQLLWKAKVSERQAGNLSIDDYLLCSNEAIVISFDSTKTRNANRVGLGKLHVNHYSRIDDA